MGRSLRSKVRWVYAGVLPLVPGLVVAQYVALWTIKTRLRQGDVVAELLQDGLEMRRFEKKFYASGEHGDLVAVRDGAEVALEGGRGNAGALSQHAGSGELGELHSAPVRYRTGLGQYPGLAGNQREELVESIRNAGSEASALTKVLSQRACENLGMAVQVSRTVLLVATGIALFLVLLGGWWLTRRILAPLRSMEDQLRAIGSGARNRLSAPTRDRELASFVGAFNGMLDEQDTRQGDLRRSERLAALGVLVSGVALDHVFEPFYRGHEEGSGSGLGLFVAQEIVQDPGGAVGVIRCPLGGTRFQVWLPCECEDRS
ncbi:MAG: ATP-binding protein [Pseudomonadota bacterium]